MHHLNVFIFTSGAGSFPWKNEPDNRQILGLTYIWQCHKHFSIEAQIVKSIIS